MEASVTTCSLSLVYPPSTWGAFLSIVGSASFVLAAHECFTVSALGEAQLKMPTSLGHQARSHSRE